MDQNSLDKPSIFDIILKKVTQAITVLSLLVACLIGLDQFMSKYAKAADVKNNSRDIGELIQLQKAAIEESRRAELKRQIRDLKQEIANIENKACNRELTRAEERELKNLKSDKKEVESRLR